MGARWKKHVSQLLKNFGKRCAAVDLTLKYPILLVRPGLWATEAHQHQRPHKLCWKFHSILFLLPHRAGSASHHASCLPPPTARCLERTPWGWDPDPRDGLQPFTQAPRVIPSALHKGQKGGVSARYPMPAPYSPGTGHSPSLDPRAPPQHWKGLLMRPQTPWQEDPSLIYLKSRPLPHLPLFMVTLMALSLDLYHCVLEVARHTPCGSPALLWALQELACMLGCSDNLCLLIPLQAPRGLSTHSKANRDSTTLLTAVTNTTYVHW